MQKNFGIFGGQFVPETLIAPLSELESSFLSAIRNGEFRRELASLLSQYAGRPTPLYFAERLSKKLNMRIYLKREDLLHTGAHKINNTLGQALLAKRMGKKRIIAETGAGQHGLATATAAALLGLSCDIYMGKKDMERQKPNVYKMELLGARVIPVCSGSQTLKDAINEALRDYSSSYHTTHYLLGSALGPHPYPSIVAYFQSIIGKEARKQILQLEKQLPNYLVACVGGGSNAIGLFLAFLNDNVSMIGVEAGGKGISTKKHAARLSGDGQKGILHGCLTYVLQTQDGQIRETHSVSAGLDYPAVGPQHSYLHSIGRVRYVHISDAKALSAFYTLSRLEGIIPALESAHALAYLHYLPKESCVIVNLSGRGDKDLEYVRSLQ